LFYNKFIISNRNEYQEYFLGVKAAGAYGWQPYHHPVPLSWNLGTLNSWNPLGHSRPLTGLLYIFLPLYASTCFEHYVMIIRRSKLYYTAFGVITPVGGRPVHRLRDEIKQPNAQNLAL